MKSRRVAVLVAAALIAVGCGSRQQEESKKPAEGQAQSTPPSSPAPNQAPASTPPPSPAPDQTAAAAPPPSPAPTAPPSTPPPMAAPQPDQEATPVGATAKPAPKPAPKPQPKTYTVDAGTAIAVRTIDAMNTKRIKSENEFETALVNPLTVDGYTLAKAGAPAIGTVVNATEGGRVKGRASMTLALSRILLSSGHYLALRTNTVSQEAKSGTKKNMLRTGVAAGAGAAIGAIAGGGKGAAIGAGIGGGAGVATNLATKGPAAEIPAGAVLTFTTTQPASITVNPQ